MLKWIFWCKNVDIQFENVLSINVKMKNLQYNTDKRVTKRKNVLKKCYNPTQKRIMGIPYYPMHKHVIHCENHVICTVLNVLNSAQNVLSNYARNKKLIYYLIILCWNCDLNKCENLNYSWVPKSFLIWLQLVITHRIYVLFDFDFRAILVICLDCVDITLIIICINI